MVYFLDRTHAGKILSRRLEALRSESPIVLGIARGGVIVADEVARELGAPLGMVVVRKIGVPGQEEFAMGAIGEDGSVIVDDEVRARSRVSDDAFARALRRAGAELERRRRVYRAVAPQLDLRGRTVILVDDGVATGSTALAAVAAVRRAGASRIVFAVPVAIGRSDEALARAADDFIASFRDPHLGAIGAAYKHFDQVEDDDVIACVTSRTISREKGQG